MMSFKIELPKETKHKSKNVEFQFYTSMLMMNETH